MQGSARIDELRQKFHENPRRYFAPLANEYRKAGDPEQAIAICRAHLAQQPAHMSGHVVYAQALLDAGRVDESRVVFEKALSLDPDNAVVHRRLGDISRQKGDTAEARHWYTRALDADPHDRELAAYIAELTEPLTESAATEPAQSPVASVSLTPSSPEMQPVAESVVPETAAVAEEALAGGEEPVAEAVELVETVAPEQAAEEPVAEAVEPAETVAPEQAVESADAAQLAPTPGDEAWHPSGEESETQPVEELATPADAEVEIPKTEEPPSLTDMPGFEVDEALFAADEDIELFPDSSSPFVTRTMADLYARQGYNDQALEVYRKLAADNPNDEEIADRIRELSPAAEESPPESPFQPDSAEAVSAPNEFGELTDDAGDFGFTPVDDALANTTQDSLVEPTAPDSSGRPVHFSDRELSGADEWNADSWAASLSSEETEVVPFAFTGSDDAAEQTDDEISASYDAPQPADEEASASIVTPSDIGDEISPIEVAAESAPEATEPAAPAWDRSDSSLIAEMDRTGDFAVAEPPLGILNDAREEIRTEDYYRPFDESQGAEPPEEPAAVFERAPEEPSAPVEETAAAVEEHVVEVETVREEHVEVDKQAFAAEQLTTAEEPPAETEEAWRPEDSTETEQEEPEQPEHFVAYSPQPPDDEDLPHYTPVGPTIREFFATLGAYRPPTNGYGASFTAHAVVPDIDAEPSPSDVSGGGPIEASAPVASEQQPADEFPLVSDAFANLFPDSPVSEEDSKAAFALSGAMSSQPSQPPTRPVATPASPAPPVEAQPAATQESEDDIRRFREWLDGLAES